jgi:hypothetical protein
MTDRELMQQSFERMTGVADAWTNPALMQTRNGFIQGWEAARLSAPEPNIVQDAIVYGTGITKDGKRIDPDSIYKEPEPPCKTGSQCIGGKCPQCVVSEPEPVAWKELTTAETKALWSATKKAGAFAALISAKLKEKNNG